MKKTKYRTWYDRIEIVEIEKETEHFIVTQYESFGKIKSRRHAKRSDYDNYFDTFDEAKAFLLNECNKKIESLENQIEHQKNRIEKINKIREP